jgi:integrase
MKVKGKLIRRSLKSKSLSVGKLRLSDLEKQERQMAENASSLSEGKMTFGDALQIYRQRLHGDASLKPRTKAHREERIAVLLKTWPSLETTDVRKITKQDCLQWGAGYSTSAVNFNKTAQTLRLILDIPIEGGIRYDNPARFIKTMKVRQKPLQLPSRAQFHSLIESVRAVNKRFSHDAADLIEFLAYGGYRKAEAKNICWSDCNFEKGEILVRGDEKTGTKNWTVRTVPMIPGMRKLLERLKAERPGEPADAKIMQVSKCSASLRHACKRLGIPHITHHDLRHLFATTCIESGVDIPTVSRWLGHKDGGALAMKVYGHLRDQHSVNMARLGMAERIAAGRATRYALRAHHELLGKILKLFTHHALQQRSHRPTMPRVPASSPPIIKLDSDNDLEHALMQVAWQKPFGCKIGKRSVADFRANAVCKFKPMAAIVALVTSTG